LEIFTMGVFPTASLILLRGGPYPLPLLAMLLLLLLLCFIFLGVKKVVDIDIG
jgi:hypothetical protein